MLPKEIQDRVDQWLNGPIDPQTKQDIQSLSEEELQDAFGTNLTFGTGGMRGIMGPGPNRMNLYTVQMATQGLANYLKANEAEPSVFISYDPRHNSHAFAHEAARVLAGNGIRAHITQDIRPTPYVSFGLRELDCTAGIMITASHNPKEYNGYKVYWSDGGQVVSPHDTGIVSEVSKIQDFDAIKLSPEKSPLIEMVSPEFDLEYLDALKKLQLDPKEDQKVGDQLKITYSPLHGTGGTLLPRALISWGFSNLNIVDHQVVPDGDFPTVKKPNPEEPDALAMGIKQLQDTLSDLFIATDPDADRMAVVVLHRDKPHILTGNQIAVLLLEYICRAVDLPKNGAVVTTIVSTDLISVIAKSHNLTCFEVLTGFKYIGELIHKWEKDHSHTFLFGAEESYGYLMGTHSRDKDAMIAACLIAEVALLMKVEGRTLIDLLDEIYKKHGLYYEGQKVLEFAPGQKGMKEMQDIMDSLRKNSPKDATTIEDYKEGLNGLPPSNVLLYRFPDKSKIVIRPSGTEPKLKIYGAVYEPSYTTLSEGMATCEQKLEKLFNRLNFSLPK